MPNCLHEIDNDLIFIIDNYCNKYVIQFFYDLFFFNGLYSIEELREIKMDLKKMIIDMYFDLKWHHDTTNGDVIINKTIYNKLNHMLFCKKDLTDKIYKYIFWDVIDFLKCEINELNINIKIILLDFINTNHYFNFSKYKNVLYENNYVHDKNEDYYFGVNYNEIEHNYDYIIYNDNLI